MGKIITVACHKGGVGKTTTALNLGFSLSRFGQKVLLIDSDPQGAMAIASNLKKRTTLGLVNLLKNDALPEDVVVYTKDNLMAIAGNGITEPEDVFFFEREARKGNLGKIIRSIAKAYDYVFIDSPAGIGNIVTALLGISSSILMPIHCRTIAVRTLPSFLRLTQKIREKLNPDLYIEGVIITMIDPQDSEFCEELRNAVPPSVLFQTVIPFDESFETASVKAAPVALIPGGESAARAYMNLAMELKTRELSGRKKDISDKDVEGLF
ncbi:ParA family protein [Desulfonema magnum]|uniref:AAA ATPase domain-containing protein n=1 Tax=Desulfonema magnum TaxID=45655 RepID=A0A975GQP3_9BACT|nr:ParA family protein [Desulfonema magnum]QTA90072.1 AAA ATPase domain-containing protein [Desulfonema magnum]